jgi:hypothetical protein
MAAAVDTFATVPGGPGLGDCYANHAAIAPNDGTDLGFVTRAIYVGGAGAIAMTVGGVNVTYSAVPVGTVLRVRASRVLATGTTATLMVALW